ncbi:hypothetical protein CPB97_011816, partial [Podila verticillata]
NNLPDPFADEDAMTSLSTWTSSSSSTGKRAAAQMPQTSNKKRNAMARDEYVSVEESLDSDETINEHNGTGYETVVDRLKVTMSAGARNDDKTVMGDNDNDDDHDDDEVNDQDEEDGQGKETLEDLIQELQELEEESEPGFHPLIRALYHAARGELYKKPQHKPHVAISGIVDLDVHNDYPQRAALISECRAAINLQYPKIRDHLQTYRKFVDDDEGLKEARLGELMKQLKGDMSRFEDDSDEIVTIEILRILVKLSLPDKYERVKSTETSTIYVWFSIWKHLFSSTAVDVQIGETILKEAQQDQLAVRKVVGARAAMGAAGTSGRRLDFRLVASIRKARKFIPFTLCNNEHKAPDTKPQVIKIQHRKNMRLNKSVAMNGWIPRETSTMFLDVVGLESVWNIITPHGDAMLSCKVQEEPLILPANAFEMGTFLCGNGMERLLGYRQRHQ